MAKKIKKKNYISPVESTIAMLVDILIFSTLYISPEVIAIYYKTNGQNISIPIFNIDILESFRVLIIIMLVVSVLKESLKIVWRKWNLRNSIVYVMLNGVYSCLYIAFLSRMEIWNDDAIEKLYEYVNIPFGLILSGIIFIIIVSVVVDTIVILFKGFRNEVR